MDKKAIEGRLVRACVSLASSAGASAEDAVSVVVASVVVVLVVVASMAVGVAPSAVAEVEALLAYWSMA